MATINASQDYDMIQTLTFEEASGTCAIRLYRGSLSNISGTVKIRAGTSGTWSDLSVSGTTTTFNVTNTTMQIAHDWNKSGNDYTTCSFYGQSTNLTGIAISQKAVLSGVIGTNFMNNYARGCTSLTSLDVPDTSGITSVGPNFMYRYAYACYTITSLGVPDTSGITSVGSYFMNGYTHNCTSLTSLGIPDTSSIITVDTNFMSGYATGCSALTTLILPSVGWFATHDVNWSVPSARLTYLKGNVLNGADLTGWRALTTSTSPNTLYLNYIQNTTDVYDKINASQDYDIIQTLTFEAASGTCAIRLYRGSTSAYTGTVKVREGTSGAWSDLSVSGTATTFNVTSTTMQVAHDWNKSGNNYMTCSFYEQSTNLTGIAISQKAVLSGAIGNYFMYNYARGCSKLTSLDVPDTSSITTVGNYFMRGYAYNCTSLTSLDVPDTSGITGSVGTYFMYSYADGCTNLTSLDVPDTSGITGGVDEYFMAQYAYGCSKLTSLSAPNTSGITTVGNYFMYSYAFGCSKLTSLDVPDTSSITSVGTNFMYRYAFGCNALTTLILPSVGWFATHDVNWGVPAARLTYLKGYVLDSADLTGWRALTTSTSPNTLYINYIQNTADVYSSDREITITHSIGFQYSLTPIKNISKALSSTIGQQFNYTYLVFEARFGTASSSIGFQTSLTPTKNINKTLSNSIGYQSNLEFTHNINYALSNSIGEQTYIAWEYGIIQTILESIGDTFSSVATTAKSHSISESIGFIRTISFNYNTLQSVYSSVGTQQTLSFTHNILNVCLTSIGETKIISALKNITKTIIDVIGLQHIITWEHDIHSIISDSVGFNFVKTAIKDVYTTILNSVGWTILYRSYQKRKVYVLAAIKNKFVLSQKTKNKFTFEKV